MEVVGPRFRQTKKGRYFVQCIKLEFLAKGCCGCKKFAGLGRLDKLLKKEEPLIVTRMNQSGGTPNRKQLKAEEVFRAMYL